MRMLLPFVAGLAMACTRDVPPKARKPSPRSAVGLVGDWVRVAPTSLRGDTLTFRADSTAFGIVPWDGRLTIVKRWKIMFTSRDAVVARDDWAQGHKDGGDPECSFGDGVGCISGPILCLGVGKQYQCEAFKYTADSLALSRGSRFIRLSRHPTLARNFGCLLHPHANSSLLLTKAAVMAAAPPLHLNETPLQQSYSLANIHSP